MAETSASSDFSKRVAELINATGVKPRRIEGLLRGRATAVRHTTIYNWINGSSLPLSLESLLAVVHACANHAQVKVSPAALRSDREWTALLAEAKQERDSQAGQSAQTRHRGPGEPGSGDTGSSGPGAPPSWEVLHPAEASDRLTRLDKRDPDRAVAEMYRMEPGVVRAVLKRMDHNRAISLLERVQPAWVSERATESGWFRAQIHQMSAERGDEVFLILSRNSPYSAAQTLAAMEPDQALRFLGLVDPSCLNAVLKQMSRKHIDQLLDRMTPDCATAALMADARWASDMLMIQMDRPRAEMTIGRIGSDGLTAVLRKTPATHLARLIAAMDRDETAGWLARMEPGQAAYVLQHVDQRRVAALVGSLDQGQPAPWLGRLTAEEAASLLEYIDPQDAAALIGSLEQQHAARCLTKMLISGAARVLAASVNATGPAQAAGIVRQMDPGQAVEVLGVMNPDQYVPVLKQGGPDLLNALLAAQERTTSGATVALIASALASSPGDIADLLTVNSPFVSAKVVEALSVRDTAEALASMDVNQAHQVLRLVPRVDNHADYPEWVLRDYDPDRYTGEQIDILKAVREFDANRADRLAEMLGLAAPQDGGSGNAGADAGH